MATEPVVYRDIDLRFRPHPLTGDVPILQNEAAVKQVVRNVVLTNHYERFQDPYFGGNVTAQLFQNATKITAMIARDDIRRAVAGQVPEAELINVSVVMPGDTDLHTLQASIVFTMRRLRKPVDVRVFLTRVR